MSFHHPLAHFLFRSVFPLPTFGLVPARVVVENGSDVAAFFGLFLRNFGGVAAVATFDHRISTDFGQSLDALSVVAGTG